MENDNRLLSRAIIDLNLILTNRIEGFDFETKHKKLNIDTEFKILHLLVNYGRLTPNEIVSKLYIAKSNLSNQCKLMMKEGLIKQYGDKDDKRVVCYGLCPKGEEKYNEVMSEVLKSFDKEVNVVNIDEIKEHITKIGMLLD